MTAIIEREHRVERADGRTIVVGDIGAPDARPILFCHGGNDCRLEALWIADAVAAAGVRMVTPDRPGFGGSTHDPRRTFVSWVDDARVVLDQLELERVDVVGLSGGGPHALALAARLPERIGRVDVVASPCPWQVSGFMRGLWPPIAITYLAARYAPTWIFRGLQRAMNDPARNVRYASRMPAPDARLLLGRAEVSAALVRSVSEAHAQGFDGAVHEWRLYTRPWGFEVGEIQRPVRLWYGDSDGMAPPAMGRWLAEHIDGSTLEVVPDRAHLSIFVQEAPRFLSP